MKLALCAPFLLLALSKVLWSQESANTALLQAEAATHAAKQRSARLEAVRRVTLTALDYAKSHDQAIPSAEQLARHMGVLPVTFRFKVYLAGSLNEHMERVDGWPLVLIGEKQGGQHGEWAFGFVDGMCSVQSAEDYEEVGNINALRAIAESQALKLERTSSRNRRDPVNRPEQGNLTK